jgi:hypothetical protein
MAWGASAGYSVGRQPRQERMLMSTSISPEGRSALLDCDQRFFEALMAADVAALEDLLADEFILVGVNDGAVVPRSALIEAVASGAVRFPTITPTTTRRSCAAWARLPSSSGAPG